MTKQFVYQDAHGHLYPAHGALAFQPGLVPGWYDTETKTFTPTGNPQAQVGSIVTDAGVGAGQEKVLSGLRADQGADTAPINHGVVFTQTPDNDPDAAAQRIEIEAQLAAERERTAALEARIAGLDPTPPAAADSVTDALPESAASASVTDTAEQDAPPRVRRARPPKAPTDAP